MPGAGCPPPGLSEKYTGAQTDRFYSKEMDRWAYLHVVSLEFIGPGKPIENSYIESFNDIEWNL